MGDRKGYLSLVTFWLVLGWRSVNDMVGRHAQGCGELLLPSPRASGLEPSLRAVPGPTDTTAAQAKQRIVERIEMVESADGAGNGQVAWRKVLVRRRDAWATLSSNTIFNAGGFVRRHWHAWPCQDASCATDMTSILIKVMLDPDSVARTTPSSLWQSTTQLSFQPELLAHALET